MILVTPFVSVLDSDPENRFPVCIYDKGPCELADRGGCFDDGHFYGTYDGPAFCAIHFHVLHSGGNKQSHIEPMTQQELALSDIVSS
jgi:hypothetical protein